jgi:DpnII restriction endonuclease/uncharacterized protein DUF2321
MTTTDIERRDLMLICRNGHVITDRLRARPDLRLPRCDVCGADTLDRCPTCAHLFAGAFPVPGFEPVGTRGAPAVCTTCGTTFPWARPEEPAIDEPLSRLERLFRRLPRLARELGRRERAPLVVRDDRDLDDLLRALLVIEFDDVRPQARTPRYESGNRTMYYLGEESIAVVGHLMRVGMDEIEVARRFAEEVAELRRRAECDALVQLVYDPERRLPNPQRLEAASRCDNLRCVIVW